MINAAQPRKGPEDYPDPSRGNIHGDLRWPTVDSDDNNPNTGTQHVQLPIVERGPRKESKKKRHLIVGAVAAVTLGVIGGGGYALGKQGGGDHNPGETVNPETHSSASQTPGPETSATSPDIVTGDPEAGKDFTVPKRPEELIPTAEVILGTEAASTFLIDMTNAELAASILTHEGRSASFDGVALGGEWVFPAKRGPLDGPTTEGNKPTFKHRKDGGLAFRTELPPLFDAVQECEEANRGKDCAYALDVDRPTGGVDYPLYYHLDSDDDQIPDQTVRVRTPLTEDNGATITLTGYDKKTGQLINTQTFEAPLSDVLYKDKDGQYHATWIPYPTNRN